MKSTRLRHYEYVVDVGSQFTRVAHWTKEVEGNSLNSRFMRDGLVGSFSDTALISSWPEAGATSHPELLPT